MVRFQATGPAALDTTPAVPLEDDAANRLPAGGVQVGVVVAQVLLFPICLPLKIWRISHGRPAHRHL